MTTREPVTRGRRPAWFREPGWPLYALFTGYPIWWVLGLGEFASLVFTVPMAIELARRGNLRAPRGIGVWLLFVFWVVGGIFVLQVHAPGTVTGASSTRYPTFVYRLLWYVAATIVLLYVVNTRHHITKGRISQALGNMFVVVTFGGVLGIVAPHLQFRSVLEYLLPGAIRGNGFVHTLIHPVTAQVQTFLGYEEARPSAPFAFTNEWGLAMACFLPFFVISWCRRDAGWRRTVAPVVLFIATVGAVFSLNRGLWLALAASGVYVAVRYALMGHLKVLAMLAGAVAAAAAFVVVSPLGGLVLDRIAHPDSNQGRTNLGSLTVSSVLTGSPLIGFGTTRNVQGNFSSIASAASALCPGCSPPPLGTQGHLWLVLFCQGVVGLALYVAFFVGQFVRNLRLTSPYAIAAQTVILVHLVTMPVYDSIGPSLFAIMIAVGLLCREAVESAAVARRRLATQRRFRTVDTTVRRYLDAVRQRAWGLVGLALLGALLGAGYQATRGTPVIATQSLLVPAQASGVAGPVTLDTDAQLVTSDRVLAALAASQPRGVPRSVLADRLDVFATPNSRILHISFTAGSARQAVVGVDAVTAVYAKALGSLTGAAELRQERTRVVQVVAVHRSLDPWIISAVSGAMVATSLGLSYALLIGERRSRVRHSRRSADIAGLPVLATVSSGLDGIEDARLALDRLAVSTVLATPRSATARTAARSLDDGLGARGALRTTATAVVASTRTRLGELTKLHQDLESTGQHVAGVVLVEERR